MSQPFYAPQTPIQSDFPKPDIANKLLIGGSIFASLVVVYLIALSVIIFDLSRPKPQSDLDRMKEIALRDHNGRLVNFDSNNVYFIDNGRKHLVTPEALKLIDTNKFRVRPLKMHIDYNMVTSQVMAQIPDGATIGPNEIPYQLIS